MNYDKKVYNISFAYLKKYSQPFMRNEKGQTIIFDPVFWTPDLLYILINKGFKINQGDFEGKTPIFYAHTLGGFAMLIAYGALLQHNDKYNRNVLFYVKNKHIAELVTSLIKLRFRENIEKQKDVFGRYFLSYSAFHNHSDSFQCILPGFLGEQIEICELSLNSMTALNALQQHKVHYFFSEKIILTFNPVENTTTFQELRKFIKEQVTLSHFNKMTFFYQQQNSNLIQLFKNHY